MNRSLFALVALISLGGVTDPGPPQPQGVSKPEMIYSLEHCQLETGATPLQRIGDARDCVNRLFDLSLEGITTEGDQLIRDEDHFKVILENDAEEVETWYNNEIHEAFGGNAEVQALAIVAPGLEVKFAGRGMLIFYDDDDLFDTKTIWCWHGTSSGTVTESRFVDLLADDEGAGQWPAGESPSEQFVEYLMEEGGWENSGMDAKVNGVLDRTDRDRGPLTVAAILPESCRSAFPDIAGECRRIPEFMRKHPDYFSGGPGGMKCISDFLERQETSDLSILVRAGRAVGQHFVVTEAAGVPSATPGFDPLGDADIAWAELLCGDIYDNIIARYQYGIDSVLVLASEDRIICGRKRADGTGYSVSDLERMRRDANDLNIYQPLQFIDQDAQATFVQSQRRVGSYEGSVLKRLVESWLDGSGRYGVLAVADASPTDLPHVQLISALDAATARGLQGGASATTRILLEDLEKEGRYLRWAPTEDVPVEHWMGAAFIEWEDPWVASLAAWQQESVYLQSASTGTIAAFVTDHGQVWAVANEPGGGQHQKGVDLFALTEKLYGAEDNARIELNFGQALKASPQLASPLQEITGSLGESNAPILYGYFLGDASGITADRGPLAALEPDGSKAFSALLQRRFDARPSSGLQLLLGNAAGTQLRMHPQRELHTLTEQALLATQDPWCVWLVLMDNDLRTVGSRLDRWCFVTGRFGQSLWGWSAIGNAGKAPQEALLARPNDHFGLTNVSLGTYIAELPASASERERNFYLDHADGKPEFVLMDFLEPTPAIADRCLLFRWELETNVRQLFRVADKVDIAVAVPCYIVDTVANEPWAIVGERYSADHTREHFRDQLAHSTEQPLAAWFGIERLGLRRGDELGLFIHDAVEHRSFGFLLLSKLIQRTQADTFIFTPGFSRPHKNNSVRDPIDHDYARSWVAKDWDRHIWRANPLGYFDRLN